MVPLPRHFVRPRCAGLIVEFAGVAAMALRWIRWVVLVAALATLGIGLGSPKAFAQVDDFGALQRQIGDLFHKGKYSEAGPIAERYVALARKRLGEEHREFAVASSWLAYIYQAQGRYAEAEPLFKRTLVIVEKTQGPGHPDFATNLNSLARLYQMQGRLAEAEPPYKRSLVTTLT
jgi:tetratricopeptide (TPR) repeat protein